VHGAEGRLTDGGGHGRRVVAAALLLMDLGEDEVGLLRGEVCARGIVLMLAPICGRYVY
jgi:hypothetical protein